MKYFTDENGVWGKKHLDPQIICFKPEIDDALAENDWLFKIEQSNSGLRYILTMVGGKGCDWGVSADDKGHYVKTLKMTLLESIIAAKKFIGPHRPILVDEVMFMKKPTEEWLAFNRWFDTISDQGSSPEDKKNAFSAYQHMIDV